MFTLKFLKQNAELLNLRNDKLQLLGNVVNIRKATSISAVKCNTLEKDFTSMPGPKSWPIVGNIDYIRKGVDSYHLLQMEYTKRYGGLFKDTIFGYEMVSVTDCDLAQKVYKAEGKGPIRDYTMVLKMYFEEKDHLGFAKSLAQM